MRRRRATRRARRSRRSRRPTEGAAAAVALATRARGRRMARTTLTARMARRRRRRRPPSSTTPILKSMVAPTIRKLCGINILWSGTPAASHFAWYQSITFLIVMFPGDFFRVLLKPLIFSMGKRIAGVVVSALSAQGATWKYRSSSSAVLSMPPRSALMTTGFSGMFSTCSPLCLIGVIITVADLTRPRWSRSKLASD